MKIDTKQLTPNKYRFPHWTKVAKTYGEAVEKVFKEISETRPFISYREGKLGSKFLRETKRKEEMMPIKDGFVELEVQMGEKYKGKSVKEARELFAQNEFGLGAYEVGCILLANPSILKDSNDLWIDCAGDEYVADGEWSSAPVWYFNGGRLEFAAHWFDRARSHCGSASAFVDGSVNNLTLEKKGDTLESCHIKTVSQNFKLSTKELGAGVILRVTLDIINMVDEE